jgi:hypothetical protein
MAADIVRNQRYSGQSIDRVFQDLGQGDFYQNLDEVSEYVLERAGTGWRNSAEYYLEFDHFDKDWLSIFHSIGKTAPFYCRWLLNSSAS